MATYTARYPIHTYEADPYGKASFGAIFRFLQDIAAAHAVEIGYGLEDMKSNQTMWVLSRFLYHAARTPHWRETLEIETWPSGTERLFALRDWVLRDEAGSEVGIATSSWVVIDIERRTPVRVERIADRMDMVIDRHLFDRSPAKLPAFDLGEPDLSTRATFSDMDLNGHVNSTRYIEWMFDGLPEGFLEGGSELVEIEVNFNGESRAGDALEVYTRRSESSRETPAADRVEFLHSVASGATIVSRARSVWAPAKVATT